MCFDPDNGHIYPLASGMGITCMWLLKAHEMEFVGMLDEFGPVISDEPVSYMESDTHLSAGGAASIISSSQFLCNS